MPFNRMINKVVHKTSRTIFIQVRRKKERRKIIMNKLFTKIAALALGATMAVGVGVAVSSAGKEASPVFADYQQEYVLDGSTTATGNAYATPSTVTQSSIGWKVVGNTEQSPWRIGGKGLNGVDRAIYSTSAISANISKIEVSSGATASNLSVNSLTITVHSSAADAESGSNAVATKTVTSGIASSTVTFEKSDSTSWASKYYRIVYNVTRTSTSGNGYITFNNAKFYSTVATSYTVTKNGTNCTISGASTVDGSQAENFTITPSTNYDAPETITVKAGSTTLTQNTHYTYYTSDYVGYLTLNKNGQTGNITITAVAVAQLTVTDSVTHGSLSSAARIHSGDDLDISIVPDSGYTYPTSVTVTMGGSTVAAEYNSSDGTLYYTPVTGNIVVTATCPAAGNTYSITTTVTNGTYSGDTSITDNGGVASVTIAPTGDYKLPTSVSVSGADHTYYSSTGVISLSNATGNVTISAAMVALTEYTITVNETNGTHTGASSIKESRSASLTFTPSSGYGQPSSVTVSGATYTWTRSSGVLSLSNPTGNVIVTYEAVGNELDSITISANSGSYTLGDDFVKPTVTAKYTAAADADVTSSATYSGYDPYTTGNQSVTISYTEGGITKTALYTATVSAASIVETVTWTRVTSASTLFEGGTFIMGHEATANSGVIVPMRTEGTATTSAAGMMYSGTTAGSSGSGTINMSTLGDNGSAYEVTIGESSAVADAIYVKVGDNYLGNTNTKNNCKLFTEQSTTTSYTLTAKSDDKFQLRIDANSSYYDLSYNTGSPRFAVYGGTQANPVFYKKTVTQTGSADLIRITATYTGGEKYVGDTIHTSDFAVKKQLNTGNELFDVASGYTISTNTLSSTSNTITVSYTENNITETVDVVVTATERAATVTSVTLVQGAGVVKDYIDYSAAAWDYTDLTVHCVWSDSTFNEDLSVADLIQSGDATVSPAKPAVGVTSFTISYTYHETAMTSNTVSGITVVADYVTNISWTGTSASHFKAFSGGQLTAAQVGTWSVVPTLAGAGVQSALSFGSYTLKVGDKTISSLPYTWVSEDDGQELSITYGKDVDGEDFVKKNATAVANICATINAIDHDESSTGAQSIDLDVANATFDPSGTSGTGSEATAVINGFTITTDKGYFDSGNHLRVYQDGEFTISSSNTITAVSYTFTGGKTGLAGGSNLSTTEFSETATGQARITSIHIDYEGTVTTTTHYANQMEHFDAQKKVVEFAKFMNTTMNGTNVCSGTFANLESAWDDVADKYDELFGASTTLSETELAWAKKMFQYASAVWGSNAEAACVEKAMKTYEYCVDKYDLDPFMDGVRSVGRVSNTNPIAIINSKTNVNVVAIVVITSVVSLTAIGGYFFLRKRREQN